MMGETSRSNPTVQVRPWDLLDDPMASMASPFPVAAGGFSLNLNVNDISHTGENHSSFDALTLIQRYLPSNENVVRADDVDDCDDAFSCDHFRMFEFKVRKCPRARSHDWTECPYAHPGEKARRRDPLKFRYAGAACPDFRKGYCERGDACEFAHGVFECWLHPSRYRTQPCKDGTQCLRRVCFFAHTPDQLRVFPQSDSPRNHIQSYDGSPSRLRLDSYDGSPSRLGRDFCLGKGSFESSPISILRSPAVSPPSESPPMSPYLTPVAGLTDAIRNLQIVNVRGSMSPPSWGAQLGSGFSSPRSPSTLRPGFLSLPSTPTRIATRPLHGVFDLWEDKTSDEEPVMERVESGKNLRARIYSKLSKENSLDRRVDSVSAGPDVGWVSELVK